MLPKVRLEHSTRRATQRLPELTARTSSRLFRGLLGKVPNSKCAALGTTCERLPSLERDFKITAFRTIQPLMISGISCFHDCLLIDSLHI